MPGAESSMVSWIYPIECLWSIILKKVDLGFYEQKYASQIEVFNIFRGYQAEIESPSVL